MTQHMTLIIGECCNHVNIQSDGPASLRQTAGMGDYKKFGNVSNVYKNIIDNYGMFLYKDIHSGDWKVCINCQ